MDNATNKKKPDTPWRVIYYKNPAGKEVVIQFIKSLSTKTQARVIRHITLLELFGATMGMPHSKYIADEILELRIHGSQEIRLLYCYAPGGVIIMLHGFIKKTQTLPRQDFITAQKRQHDTL